MQELDRREMIKHLQSKIPDRNFATPDYLAAVAKYMANLSFKNLPLHINSKDVVLRDSRVLTGEDIQVLSAWRLEKGI